MLFPKLDDSRTPRKLKKFGNDKYPFMRKYKLCFSWTPLYYSQSGIWQSAILVHWGKPLRSYVFGFGLPFCVSLGRLQSEGFKENSVL